MHPDLNTRNLFQKYWVCIMLGRMFQLGQLKYTNSYAARPGTTMRKMIIRLPMQIATLFHTHCFLPCCFLLYMRKLFVRAFWQCHLYIYIWLYFFVAYRSPKFSILFLWIWCYQTDQVYLLAGVQLQSLHLWDFHLNL